MTTSQWESDILEIEEDADEFQRKSIELGFGDGLPLIAPTPQRVEKMLSGTDRAPSLVLSAMPPSYCDCTIEKLAIAAVMAGCLPEYMPVLITIFEAAAQPQFNMLAVQTTTNPCGIMAIVNGPIVKAIGLNGGFGALGPGNRANSTIGRAIRLVQQNVGGAYPGTTDLSTQGSPLKFGLCFAENEQDSPWEPFHVARGFDADDSVVTIQSAEAPNALNDHASKDARSLLVTFAESIAVLGKSNPYSLHMEYLVGFGPEHAAIVANEGVTRADLQNYFYERARIPYTTWAMSGRHRMYQPPRWTTWADDAAMIPVSSSPDKIGIYVVGGSGKHSIWTSQFAASLIVSSRVERADGSVWRPND